MKERKYIVDTTLRDGEQCPGLAFDINDKVRLARIMDNLNIYQIEAGIPAMGHFEKQAICAIMENRKNSKISAWNRMDINDIKHSIDCRPDIIHICAPVSYVQIYKKLNKNKVWLINNLEKCVNYACTMDYQVTVGFEDASRADITFMISLIKMLKRYNVKVVRVADTVGILTPGRTMGLVKELAAMSIDIELHMHNTLGMACSNSQIGAMAGANYIDCSIMGIGEKAGNCNMKDFVYLGSQLFDVGITQKDAKAMEMELKEVLAH